MIVVVVRLSEENYAAVALLRVTQVDLGAAIVHFVLAELIIVAVQAEVLNEKDHVEHC